MPPDFSTAMSESKRLIGEWNKNRSGCSSEVESEFGRFRPFRFGRVLDFAQCFVCFVSFVVPIARVRFSCMRSRMERF